jgi:hypothetical protein
MIKLIWVLISLLNFILFYVCFWMSMVASMMSFVVILATEIIVRGFPEKMSLFFLSNLVSICWLLSAKAMIHVLVIKLANHAMGATDLKSIDR